MSTLDQPAEHLQPQASQTTTPVSEPTASDRSRRAFIFKISLFLNGIVGTILAVPILGYILGPAFRRDESFNSWLSLGPVSNFPEGETRLADYRNPVTTHSDGDTDKVACWVRRIQGNQFQVFAVNCAHLGCPVRWFPQSKLFMCPCHGGAYYANGSRASGPPERGLFEYHHRIVDNNLMISAGEMPTLSNEACAKKPLVQIQASAGPEAPAKPRFSSWPS